MQAQAPRYHRLPLEGTTQLKPPTRIRAPGAGVKTPDGVTDVERRNVMLDPASATILEKIGGGNLSLGVREGARRLRESGDTAKFSLKRHEARSPKKKP